MAKQAQSLFQVAVQLLQIEPDVAPGQCGEILDEQALPARIGLPVQAPARITRLVGAQALVVVGSGAEHMQALIVVLLALPGQQR
ncbi:hypothetical protein D3C85_732340 [compost metagenome]